MIYWFIYLLIYLQNNKINKYDTFALGRKRGRMATCIVIYLKTVFVDTYMYLKQCVRFF